jgi:long-chain acyl-CoA synthetase
MVLTSQKRLPCTFFVGVPPMLERLLAGADELGADLTSMRYTLSGAMALDRDLARRWEKASEGLIIEGYGMTEASPVIVGNPVSPERRPGALGVPFPSTEVRLVDPEDPSHDVAPGEVGELIARGPQVFSGYWDSPEETAEALRDGWLRTGDLALVDDGFLVMADRRKEMINAQGFNVYPSQVEDAVRSMPGVRDIAVVGVPAGASGESVVAAIVLEAGASVTLEDVRTWAEKSLAHYALPRQIVVMKELPRSQIGKVMRRRVREEILGVQERVAGLADQAQIAVNAVAAEAAERLKGLRDLREQSERGPSPSATGSDAAGSESDRDDGTAD